IEDDAVADARRRVPLRPPRAEDDQDAAEEGTDRDEERMRARPRDAPVDRDAKEAGERQLAERLDGDRDERDGTLRSVRPEESEQPPGALAVEAAPEVVLAVVEREVRA